MYNLTDGKSIISQSIVSLIKKVSECKFRFEGDDKLGFEGDDKLGFKATIN